MKATLPLPVRKMFALLKRFLLQAMRPTMQAILRAENDGGLEEWQGSGVASMESPMELHRCNGPYLHVNF